jgi:hypothetical protein
LEGFKQPKVPTVIQYSETDPDEFTWGAQQHRPGAVEGIKLLLDPDQPRPYYLGRGSAKDDLKKLGKPADGVAADFICAIYKHAMKQIESAVPKDYIDMCTKEFVLSVPAVWSDKAKDLTLQVRKAILVVSFHELC